PPSSPLFPYTTLFRSFFPIYWKWLEAIPALQVVAHRILWACVVLVGLVLASKDWAGFRAAIKSPRTIAIYTAAALVIAIVRGDRSEEHTSELQSRGHL